MKSCLPIWIVKNEVTNFTCVKSNISEKYYKWLQVLNISLFLRLKVTFPTGTQDIILKFLTCAKNIRKLK